MENKKQSKFHASDFHDVESTLSTNLHTGLSSEEAKRRWGPNEIPSKRPIRIFHLLLNQFASLLVWLLIGAAIVALFIGEPLDAWAILAIVVLNALLGFFQEYRAERSLQALQEYSTPTSKVLRDGRLMTVPTKDLVVGDLLAIEAGDRVGADARVVSSTYLRLDEASLTGESQPVDKTSDALDEKTHLAERTNMVYSGTVALAGKGRAIVTSIGLDTELGQIASKLAEGKKEETPLQKNLQTLGKKLVYICLIIVAIVFGVGVLRGLHWVEMLLVALSLAVAAIPEGLPAAVTISLSIGVRKMAEKKALIRRLSSVETLGATRIICSDKTGTLTQNEMTVRSLWVGGKTLSPEDAPIEDAKLSLRIAAVCNSASLHDGKVTGDPTEGALLVAAANWGVESTESILSEHPFDSTRKRMSVTTNEGIYVKGAPDILLELCTHMLVDGEEVPIDKEMILNANRALAQKAYRVLAVAYGRGKEEKDLVFTGLFGMLDPPRPEVRQAIEKCRSAGINTVMVTGDHKETAIAIARELTLFPDGSEALDGHELDALSDPELDAHLPNIALFSRISPEHKLRIIEAYKRKGEVTAMTGDGVNDAPAVQSADIGLAMGITGTDVTKESADMIILDDNFATITEAVRQGRGIYDNIVKFVSYLLSSNIAEILVLFLTMLIGLKGPEGHPFVALLPVQLLWMNLVTDGFPAISLALDPIDSRAMSRPPRPRDQPILHRRFLQLIFAIAALVTLGALAACFYGLRFGVATAQTMTFTTLIVLELVRAQMIRRQYNLHLFSNPYLIAALASSILLQLAVLYIPTLQPIFGTVPLDLMDWGVILAIGAAVYLIGNQVTRMFMRTERHRGHIPDSGVS